MASKKYVIDAYYDFDITADGPRPGNAGSSGVHLQFDHWKSPVRVTPEAQCR